MGHFLLDMKIIHAFLGMIFHKFIKRLIGTICSILPVITVSAIAELRTSKSLVMTQQEKGDVGFANAVSFPASIVNEYSSTGKSRYISQIVRAL